MAHINASELRARFGGTTLTLLEQYRLDRQRRERETLRYVTICAWCETTPPPQAHVIYSHGMCPDCAKRFEGEG